AGGSSRLRLTTSNGGPLPLQHVSGDCAPRGPRGSCGNEWRIEGGAREVINHANKGERSGARAPRGTETASRRHRGGARQGRKVCLILPRTRGPVAPARAD